MSDLKLVTINSFDNPAAASILAGRLEARGIDAFITEEHIVGMDPLWTPMVGGVKVKVREIDAERAGELAYEGRESGRVQQDKESPSCPRCGSTLIYRERFSTRLAFISILLIGFPLLFRSKKWKCSKCCRRFA